MKSYTDIEQSRKLAEILPIKSADMHYARIEDDDEMRDWSVYLSPFPKICALYVENLPCWSTQALLDEIPYTLLNKDEEDLKLHIEKDGEQYYLFYENEYTGDMFEIETNMHDDLIDACYEMIMKLKEKDSL